MFAKKLNSSKVISFIQGIGALLLISLISFFFAKNILQYNFFASHDGDYNLIRSEVAFAVFEEGQFPLRWSGTLNYLCGIPIFNFYYPLLYYLSTFAKLGTDLPTTDIVKHLYFLGLAITPVGMFLWLKLQTKNTLASFVGAIIYALSPYMLVNLYVRGSTEVFAYALLPFVLLTSSLVFIHKNPFLLVLAGIVGALFSISHNLVALVSFPFLIAFLAFTSLKTKNWLPTITLPLIWFGLSSFFWIPAILEARFIQLSIHPAADFHYHFPSVKDIFYSPWGYFYQQAPNINSHPTGMKLSLGLAQWAVLLISTLVLILKKFPKKILFPLLLTLSTIFLITSYSKPVWEILPFMKHLQYPWRLLGLAIFLTALLAANLINTIFTQRLRLLTAAFLVLLALYANRNHHYVTPPTPRIYDNLLYHPLRPSTTTTADEVISLNSQKTCSFEDEFVTGPSINGSAAEVSETRGTGSYSVDKAVNHGLTLNLEYFPKIYQIRINDQYYPYQDSQGKVHISNVDSMKGLNTVSWEIKSSPIQIASDVLTVATFFILLLSIPFRYLKKHSAKLNLKP